MKKFDNLVFLVLYIIAWIFFIGLSIEAGGLIVNFVFSVVKPEMVGNLYQKLDLTLMYQQNKWVFYGIYSFVLIIAVLKTVLFYCVIDLLHKSDLKKPFNSFVSQKILQISYFTFTIGIFSHIAKEIAKYLSHHFDTDKLNHFWVDSEAFILMAAIVYVIAVIFKKGIEIQNENDLTV